MRQRTILKMHLVALTERIVKMIITFKLTTHVTNTPLLSLAKQKNKKTKTQQMLLLFVRFLDYSSQRKKSTIVRE